MNDLGASSQADVEQQLREVNEALLVSSIRQHELAEQAQAAEAIIRRSEAKAVQARLDAERLNRQLRESERRFREMIDFLPAAIYTTDAEGRVTHFNPAAVGLVGRTPQPGDQWCVSWKMFRPDGARLPHEECPMAVALREQRPVRGSEAIIERPDGTRVWVEPYPTPIRDANGKMVGAINMLVDITERTLLENRTKEHVQALAESDRRKDEFLAMLSHELRNPLAAIQNAVQLLRLERDRTALQTEAHALISRQVANLARLVDDLLEVSRITTGRIHLQADAVDLREVVKRAVETAQPKVLNKEQCVEQALPDDPLLVRGDSTRLEQIVVNLLTNATKYTPRKGNIWVSLQVEESEAVLRVRDDGVGIAPELLPSIFDLFTQADTSLERSQGGLGIGLALVRSLVTMHSGNVDVRSAPGQGSEFVVRLPLLSSPEVSTKHPVEGVLARSQDFKILVVDDNVDAAKTLGMLLQMSGHNARVAFDGQSALQALVEYGPDVALLDIGLPDINGYQLAQRIRETPQLRNTVLVALTGYGQESDKQRSRDAGFDHHLVKPVSLDGIQSVLSAATRTGADSAMR